MAVFKLPYGKTTLACDIPGRFYPEPITLIPHPGVEEPEEAVKEALGQLLGDVRWPDWAGAQSAAVVINDKTRLVPHQHLLPPLLDRLEGLGLSPERITLIIATGAHPSMLPEEYQTILPPAILDRYPVLCHDAGDSGSLVYLGETSRRTPIWTNRHYVDADLRIVVGNIEPHQFMGFSGGHKSAAIGIAGLVTIDHNHALMTEARAQLGRYEDNPARQDVEEIGRKIGVHLALNTILNSNSSIVRVLAGEPKQVMEAGIPLAKAICQVAVSEPYDLVIASPGGFPKDINLYQAQKGLAHATLATKSGGTVILVAACPDGTGSQSYEDWVSEMRSHEDVLTRFAEQGFRVGPHKAFQIARDATRIRILLVSEMMPELVRKVLLEPAENLQDVLYTALATLPAGARIGIMPMANVTIPRFHP